MKFIFFFHIQIILSKIYNFLVSQKVSNFYLYVLKCDKNLKICIFNDLKLSLKKFRSLNPKSQIQKGVQCFSFLMSVFNKFINLNMMLMIWRRFKVLRYRGLELLGVWVIGGLSYRGFELSGARIDNSRVGLSFRGSGDR